jgi:hypothetical protein
MPFCDPRIPYKTIRMADVSFNKMTQVTERFRVQVHAECFNIANSFFVTQGNSSSGG